MIRSWLHEPLVHFLIAGAAIYGLLGWFADPVDPSSRTIALSDDDRAGIALGFEQSTGRAPTDTEMDGLVERWVREEVLYREALRLGLDREDPIVRRRLAAKMDELAGAAAETASVDDATLQDWLDRRPQRFAVDPVTTFEQRYYADEADARAALRLARPVGSPISLPERVDRMSEREVQDVFGRQFARELLRLKPGGGWKGPIPSGFGWHIVRIESRQAGTVPPLSRIRERVEADWRNATIDERRKEAYRLLRESYRVKTE